MSRLRYGGLFEGYGGLTMGVQAVLGGELAWYSENEPAANRVLEHNHPSVPNLGDITAVDWSQVDPVDVLTAGFPCQDVSAAGRRLGLRPGTRSGLWSRARDAVEALRPALFIAENVRGLLSAEAHRSVEPCPYCVGDGSGPSLRALGAVVGDLSELGYVGRWVGLRASDVGAPHGRFRVFIAAWPAEDANSATQIERWPAATHTLGGELQRRGARGVLAGQEGAGEGEGSKRERIRHEGWPESARLLGGSDVALGSDEPPADTPGQGWGQRQPQHVGQNGSEAVRSGQAESGRRGGAAADTEGRCYQNEPQHGDGESVGAVPGPGTGDRAGDPSEGVHELGGTTSLVAWGPYEPAIRRWERVLGRTAPAPTQAGKRGGRQLSPLFVEWLMGLPEGHVTAVLGLSRNEMLKLLGAGVVPAQAAAALPILLPSADEEHARRLTTRQEGGEAA